MAEGTKINEENYRALQREIVKTQNKLNDLKTENSKWNKTGTYLTNLGNELDTISDKIDKVGNKLTTRLTLPIAGALTVATKEAVEFESAFAGVTKTVDGTEEQIETLKQGIKDLSKEIPSTTTEIASVAESAGQLGIETENILSFSKAMLDLGNSTNLTAEDAASQLAKFANIMQMSQKDFDKLGSSIVDLGNNFATTESDIVNMAMRLAGAGKQVGLSEGQVLGLATALSSVGIEAEMGGSAISKAMVKMQNAVELGGEKLNNVLNKTGMTLRDLELMSANDSMAFKELSQSLGMTSTEVKNLITAGTNLEDFASVSGMTAQEFQKAWKDDAAGALSAFIKGLGDAENKGESAITMLSEMGLTEVRLRDSLLRAANAGDLFNDAIETGTDAWKENVALAKEANKRYETTESQLLISKNKIKDIARSLGDKLLPAVNKILDKVDKWTEKLDDLSDSQKENIVKIGLIVAAAGPLLKVGSTAINTIGKVSSGLGTMTKAIGVASGKMSSTETSVNNLANVFKATFSPTGLAVLGITAAVGIIVAQMEKAKAEMKSKFEAMGTAATDFYNDLQTAEGYLDSFNQTIFASSEEQENLQKQMEEIQAGITQICKTASDERRDYTQEEITQLDEYFTKLRELKDREIEIYQARIETISQLAQSESTAFKGSIEEYKERGTEWVATAQDQANELITIAENRRIEEISALNTMYSEEERLTNENYLNAVAIAEERYQQAVATANKQVGEVSAIYANGYVERAKQEDSFLNILGEYNQKVEEESNRHNQKMQDIEDGNFNWVLGKTEDRQAEAVKHHDAMKDIWEDMYENMSEEQMKEMGVWLARLADTELYGGEISEENQKMVDVILDNYNTMPEEAREIMKQTMSPMLEEMEKSEPTLWAKASGIAGGILSRLRSSFDIHSPSRETRDIFQNVMKGAELGLEDEQRKLNKQVDAIANQMKTKFTNMMPNMGAIKQSVIDQTQTVFTTPTLNIYAQDELTPNKINAIIDTVNRRLGSQY